MKRAASILCLILMSALFLDETIAQEQYLGGTFSYAGTGIEYVRDVDSNTFVCCQLRLDTSSMFWSRMSNPGISASAIWNVVLPDLNPETESLWIFMPDRECPSDMVWIFSVLRGCSSALREGLEQNAGFLAA